MSSVKEGREGNDSMEAENGTDDTKVVRIQQGEAQMGRRGQRQATVCFLLLTQQRQEAKAKAKARGRGWEDV